MDYEECAAHLIQSTAALNRSMIKTAIREFWKGETYILMYLHENASTTPSELSRAMDISTARVATTLNTLEKKGYINRQIDSKDRRKIVVTMTETGVEFVMREKRELLSNTESMLKTLGERDALEYLRIVDRMVEIIENNNWGGI